MWLFVGFSDNEIDSTSFEGEYLTLGIDGYIKGDIFALSSWRNIYNRYGEQYFDAIMTDGGLHGIERVDGIVELKQKLLKDGGFIYNYFSVIGQRTNDPLNRGYRFTFWKIPKEEYTIENHDKQYNNLATLSWSDAVKARLKLII
jgi:hypothetical protein